MSCRAPAGTNPGSGAYALWVSLTFRLVNSSKMSQDRAAQPSRSSLVMTNMSRLGRRREGRAEVEVGLDLRRSSHGRCSGDHSMSACRPPRRVRTPPDVHSSICDDADRGCRQVRPRHASWSSYEAPPPVALSRPQRRARRSSAHLPDEDVEVADRIRSSGVRVVLVGPGCPRQEVFAYAMRRLLVMALLAVGARSTAARFAP